MLTYHHQVEPSGASGIRALLRSVAVALRAGVALYVDAWAIAQEVPSPEEARESAAFEVEVKQLKEELDEAHAENKAAIQAQIDDAKKKAQVMQDQAKARIDQAKHEADAKITALQGQLKQASDGQKAKIEKRIAEVKADLEVRNTKLQEAGRLAKEALAASDAPNNRLQRR